MFIQRIKQGCSDSCIHNSYPTSTYNAHATFWYFIFKVGQGNPKFNCLEIPSLWELILSCSAQCLFDSPFALCSSLLLPFKYYSPQQYSNNALSLLFLRGTSSSFQCFTEGELGMMAVLSQNAYPQCWYSASVSAMLLIKGLEPAFSNFKTETPTTLRTPWSLS